MHKNILFIPLILISFLNCQPSNAQLAVANIFGEHMVLQRETVVKIWGTSSPNDVILFSLNRNTQTIKTNDEGKWSLEISPQEAGGPHVISISSARNKVEWKDIYFGDVYLCSGQSNMEWPLYLTENAEAEISQSNHPLIRQYKVPRSSSDSLASDLGESSWQPGNSETLKDFTAVGYYFAKKIAEHEGVPIGLINSSWGGSRIEPWMSASALGADNSDQLLIPIREREAHDRVALKRDLLTKFGPFKSVSKRVEEKTVDWERPDLNKKNWQPIEINGNWENEGYEKLDGVVWYRTNFTLTKKQIKDDYELILGTIDDSDVTFVNGIRVGGMIDAHNVQRKYPIAKSILKVGENILAVRVEDTGGGGGINSANVQMGLRSQANFFPLNNNWKIKLEAQYAFGNFNENQIPTVLYNKMIYPIRNFSLKGILWYQGESNADQDRPTYSKLFKGLIDDWRSLWGDDKLPFLFVQLAAFQKAPEEPEYSSWPAIRMAQKDALDLPNTGMAVTIDVGDAEDIHPRNKKTVGERLALSAQHIIYGNGNIYRGPNPKQIRKIANQLIIEYNSGEGLYFKNNNLSERQFSVAGPNGKFYWANPKLSNGTVVLSCPEVENPMEVRYAWASNPDQASLYNNSNLPAEPFTMKVK